MGRGARVRDLCLVWLARVVGGAGLALFLFGRGPFLDLELSTGPALALDALLSLAFFAQHSLMVRRPARAALARRVPERYLGVAYALASGLVLGAVTLLWQRAGPSLASTGGALRWLLVAVIGLAIAGFAWGVVSLDHFDPFGVQPVLAHLEGRPPRPSRLVVRGPYRWVRHPLYLATLVLIWSNLELSADRLLLDLLWTAWMVAGSVLEERDLVAELGEAYRAYQRRVPMLLPWRRPADGARVSP